ncbi:MAG TPA: AarF/UbiB family protein [Myxococcota bacterium]|nr:AarF/UbiB family protein [Myxococcota bacterium]
MPRSVATRANPAPPRGLAMRARELGLVPLVRLLRLGATLLAARVADALAAPFSSREARAARRAGRPAREAHRVAAVLGELKGPYAKLGQFAALRYDALPDGARDAFAALRDEVVPLRFGAVRPIVEAELGRPLELAFASFEPTALAAASIAQVHRARLPDGRAVAVKVQYPWLRASLPRDLRLARALLRLRALGRGRADARERLFAEFARGLAEELDFEHEARVAAEIARNLADDPAIAVPAVVASHSTGRVLTMEWHPALPIHDRAGLRRLGVDAAEVLEILARAYARQIFVDGLFHADPHPGNLFVLEERGPRGPRVLFVDFGLSRRLEPALRRELRAAILAVLRGDLDGFVGGMRRMDMIAPGAEPGVRAAVERMFARLRGEGAAPLALGADRVLALKDEAKALLAETEGLQLPNDLLLYAKTLSYLFGLGAELAPQVDLMRLTVPWLLRFLAAREEEPDPVSAPDARAAAPAAG